MVVLFWSFIILFFGLLILLLCTFIYDFICDFIEAKDFTKGPLGAFTRGIVYGFKHPGYKRIRSKYAYSDEVTVDVLEEEYAYYEKKKEEHRRKNEARLAENLRKKEEYKRKHEAHINRNKALREGDMDKVKEWDDYFRREQYKTPLSMYDPEIVGTILR